MTRSSRPPTSRARWGVLLAMLVGLVVAGLLGAAAPGAAADDGDEPVELVLFWGDGCPHCAAEKEWLATITDDYPRLTVTQYEVWYDEGNRQLFIETAEEMGFEPSGVPTTIVGEQVWVGFSDSIALQIRAVLDAATAGQQPSGTGGTGPSSRIDVPFVGGVDLADRSLAVSTVIIGFVDGVNPCSLWVISVLLTIVVRTGSRRRVLAIGSVFLAVTAGMYALYMVGLYSVMGVIAHLGAIQLGVALVAAVFGVVSVKDYFAFRKGLSFSLPESSKPGIYRRIREASGHQNLFAAIGATALLAVGVSLLETPCTAGFPVLWTGMLAANDVGAVEASGLFVLYMVPFLLDELLVFGIVVATMRAMRMQERHGQLLKLVAGTTMLALGGTLLVRPGTMQEPLGALTVFAVAFAVAAVVHVVTLRVRARRAAPASHG